MVIVVTERDRECSQHRKSGMPNKPVKTSLPWASSGRKSSQFEAEIGIVLPLRIFSCIPFIGSLGLPLEKRMKHIHMLGNKGRKLLQKWPLKVHIRSTFAPCSRNFQTVKLRSTIQEFIWHTWFCMKSILAKFEPQKLSFLKYQRLSTLSTLYFDKFKTWEMAQTY